MKSKKTQASAAETQAVKLGGEKVELAGRLKSSLDGRIDQLTYRDDTKIQQAKANAGTMSSMSAALGTSADPAMRAALITGGNQALVQTKSSGATVAKADQSERMNTAAKLRFGAQDAVSGSILSSASAQNNAASMITQAKMQNQAAMMGSVANAIGTFATVKADTDYANKLAKNTAQTKLDGMEKGPATVDYVTKSIWGKSTTQPLSRGA